MSNLDVAVVIPCYELGRTIGEALDSIEAQTVAPAEIVVVDDGSRDPYTRHALAGLGDRVTLLSTENRGPAAARNLGIQNTRSPLLVLLDADDALEPTYLEKASALLERRSDLSFVSCALQAFGNASYYWKPPPFSPAEAIARGACGHISTMFRREVWDRVGGFDVSLPAYEDVDFWLSVLELGFKGEILDEALVRYRVRHGSRYHRGISADVYQRSKAAILDRHAGSVDLYDEDVFVSLIDFQREIGAHRRSLSATRAELEKERVNVNGEVEEAAATLVDLGGTPLEWGDLLRCATSADGSRGESETISSLYRRAFLDAHPDAATPGAVTIRGGEPWPVLENGSVETLVVLEAFEQVDDVHAAFERCREALAPGGVLLATFSAVPPRTNSGLRGFTEASVRRLLAEQFTAAAVDVTTYGNLQASVAEIGGLARDSLGPEELWQVDPWHPVLIAARCQVAGTGPQPTAARRRFSGGAQLPPHPAVKNRGVILAFHRVAEALPDVHGLCVNPDVFRAEMEVLSERCTPVSLVEMTSGARDGDIPPRAVAVTFDDGYLDNYLVASPILSALSIPATFFLTTEGIDGEREPWWDMVERLLLADGDVPERLQINVNAGHLDLPTASPDERRRALFTLHGALLEAAVDDRDELLSALLTWSGRDPQVRETHRLMTAEEIRTLSERPGHDVGAHTAHHLMLPTHPLDVQRRELSESRDTLERITGRPVRALAYPYGVCDFSTTEMAESAGFTIAVSVTDDVVTPDADPLRLPRLEVTNQNQGTLGSKLEQLFERPWWR